MAVTSEVGQGTFKLLREGATGAKAAETVFAAGQLVKVHKVFLLIETTEMIWTIEDAGSSQKIMDSVVLDPIDSGAVAGQIGFTLDLGDTPVVLDGLKITGANAATGAVWSLIMVYTLDAHLSD